MASIESGGTFEHQHRRSVPAELTPTACGNRARKGDGIAAISFPKQTGRDGTIRFFRDFEYAAGTTSRAPKLRAKDSPAELEQHCSLEDRL
jgi:hypothetical protein